MAPGQRFSSGQSILVSGIDGIWLDSENVTGEGCLSFEVKGSNDATIKLGYEPRICAVDPSPDKPTDGFQNDGEAESRRTPTLPLEVVLGSHRNTKLKLCDGIDCHVLRQESQVRLEKNKFKSFWINFTRGELTLGCGPRGCACLLHVSVNIPACQLYIGFFSLDSPVAFRSIILSPPLLAQPRLALPKSPAGTLAETALNALTAHVQPSNVVRIMCVLDATWRSTHPLWARCVSVLAASFSDIALNSPEDIVVLPGAALQHALACGHLCAAEMVIFCAVESWALAHVLLGGECAVLKAGETPPSYTEELRSEPQLAKRGGAEQPSCAQHMQLAVPSPEVVQCLDLVRFPTMTAAEVQRVLSSPLWGVLDGVSHILAELHNRCVGPGRMGGDSDAGACCTGSENSSSCVHLRDGVSAPGVGDCTRAEAETACNTPQTGSPPRVLHDSVQTACLTRVFRQQDLWHRWKRQRRQPPNVAAELHFEHAGDNNGIVHYLGTNSGRNKRFLNPHLSGTITVSCSSPFCVDSEAYKLSSQQFHSNLCAHASGSSGAFWRIDLKGVSLVCFSYAVRANQSHGFPRSWRLQGSTDNGEGWTDLHCVQDSQFFQRPGQYGVWHIPQPVMLWCNSFRVIMNAPAANGTTVLNVNYVELYGYVM